MPWLVEPIGVPCMSMMEGFVGKVTGAVIASGFEEML